MKGLKKLLTGILAATLIMGSSLNVAAADKTVATNLGGDYTITVTDTNEKQDYALYKLFDATTTAAFKKGETEDGISYTLPSGKDLSAEYSYKDSSNGDHTVKGTDWFVVNNAGYITAKEGLKDTNLATEDFRQWAKNFGTLVETATADAKDDKITFTGLTEGYYYVSTTTGTLASVTSIAPNQEVKDKNSIPGLQKVEDEYTNDFTKKVNYTVTVKLVPATKNVVFHDQLTDGLTLDEDSLSVTVDNSDLEETNYTVEKFEYVETEGQDDITIKFAQAYLDSITEETNVIVSYSATVNDKAVVNEFNNAYIKYGEKNNLESKPVKVYESTFKFQVNKVDEKNVALDGAKFALSYDGTLGDITSDDITKNTNNIKDNLISFTLKDSKYNYDPDGTTYVLEANNSIVINGLDGDENGTVYYLYEVEAPLGFNKLTEAIKVSIKPEFSTTEGEESKVVKYIVSYTINNVTKSEEVISFDQTPAFNVVNNRGSLLPETGGMGTTIFYILGSILIVAGVAYFIVRRKANAE